VPRAGRGRRVRGRRVRRKIGDHVARASGRSPARLAAGYWERALTPTLSQGERGRDALTPALSQGERE